MISDSSRGLTPLSVRVRSDRHLIIFDRRAVAAVADDSAVAAVPRQIERGRLTLGVGVTF